MSECFICRDDQGEFDVVCDCTGGLERAHKACVEQWVDTSGKTRCPACTKPFKVDDKPISWSVKLGLVVVVVLFGVVYTNRELWCWFVEICKFLLIDVLGAFLRVFFGL